MRRCLSAAAGANTHVPASPRRPDAPNTNVAASSRRPDATDTNVAAPPRDPDAPNTNVATSPGSPEAPNTHVGHTRLGNTRQPCRPLSSPPASSGIFGGAIAFFIVSGVVVLALLLAAFLLPILNRRNDTRSYRDKSPRAPAGPTTSISQSPDDSASLHESQLREQRQEQARQEELRQQRELEAARELADLSSDPTDPTTIYRRMRTMEVLASFGGLTSGSNIHAAFQLEVVSRLSMR